MESLFYMQNDTDIEPNMPPAPEEDEFPADEENGNNKDETGGKPLEEPPQPVPDFPLSETGPDGTGTSIITVFPKPIIPCYYCETDQNGLVRFLNAVAGYQPFLIYINNQLAVNGLSNGEMSQYGRVSAGEQTITVGGLDGYVYVVKRITVPVDRAVTVAIINTDHGLDLMVILDMYCNAGINTGCFRVCNLSITNQGVHVILNGQSITFFDVNYMQVTSFQYVSTGFYMVSVSNNIAHNGKLLLTSDMYIRGNASYTLYVFNWSNVEDAIRILIVEDRRP
ncbi:DUF4397 domain-containing protein [Lacrimispora sphenoides]|uniref:DUF4397 domain-containing protein n=1 Tax=Lacrimispora sphenoides JCM 1415 TaxID=1297793 RepID=A0ABY1C567_9FIRM|nr:DUF4397 domain-containing protein [Lacrimispora sphenoides]SET68350.1 protein of unknown function [[Clostridium] sphenoides JCM 1415]SUY50467.1 Uncharacterised protein [Lacrimispora sphenoides]